MQHVLRPILLVALLATLWTPGARAAEMTLTIELVDEGCPAGAHHFCMLPPEQQLDTGKDLKLRIINAGHVRHNVTFAAGTPAVLAKHGMMRTLDVNESMTLSIPWADIKEALGGKDTGTFTLECGVDGHATLGESVMVQVGETDAAERPQPFVGLVVMMAVLAVAAIVGRRR